MQEVRTNDPGSPMMRGLTKKILIGMILGAVVGITINLLSPALESFPRVQSILMDWGVDGLFAVLGQGFLRLLSVLVVPLVFVSLVCGTAALHDIRKVGRIGLVSVLFYIATTAVAISLGMGLALAASPGQGAGLQTAQEFSVKESPSLVQVFIDLFPRNIVSSMAEGNMLQLILFSLLFGLAVSLSGDAGKRVAAAFEDWNAVVLKLVGIVMLLAPVGVFALIARTFAMLGLDAFGPLLKYFCVVLGALLLHGFGTYSLILWFFGRLDPRIFFRKMREVHAFAFSTASSNATIPVTLTTLETRLGVPNPIAAFTVPLGATINMDGTAIMQGVATVFIAQVYGIELGLSEILMVILTATLASIGTAGVPGVGLVMLGMVLNQVGLPVEGIAMVLGVDRLLDMVRTAVNVTGDAMVSCIVARREGELDLEMFNATEASAADKEAVR